MKKILIVNNTIFYENENELFLNKETGNFFIDLKILGNEISTFQISQPKTNKDSFANFSITDKGVKIYQVKRNKHRFIPFLRSFFVIQKAILQNDFVYIFYPGPICLVISLMCIFYKKPYGLYIRGEQGINSKMSLFIFKRAKVIFTISPKFTQNILSYNINTHTIRPMTGFDEADIVKEKAVNFEKKVNLLFVGRIVFDKGLFELIEAIKILKEKKYKIHLNIAGAGQDFEKLALKVRTEGLIDEVTFHGMISEKSELINLYMKSDIFILPTHHEGFPRVLYEAMMMNIPIVTTFVGTISYLMEDRVNCLMIKAKDINSIVCSIEELIVNPILAQRIADKGRVTIEDYLSDKKNRHSEQLNKFIQGNWSK